DACSRDNARVLDLDQQRVALATAGADRCETEAAAVAAQLVHHRAEDAAAARADRVAERDRTTVDVDDLFVGSEHPRRVERYGGERLVDLDTLDVSHGLARFLE